MASRKGGSVEILAPHRLLSVPYITHARLSECTRYPGPQILSYHVNGASFLIPAKAHRLNAAKHSVSVKVKSWSARRPKTAVPCCDRPSADVDFTQCRTAADTWRELPAAKLDAVPKILFRFLDDARSAQPVAIVPCPTEPGSAPTCRGCPVFRRMPRSCQNVS